MLSWFDAASYTERARPGYEVLIELKTLSWCYMNLCGMCRDPQHSAPVLVLANSRNTIVTCTAFPFLLWITLHVRVGMVVNRVPSCPRQSFTFDHPSYG